MTETWIKKGNEQLTLEERKLVCRVLYGFAQYNTNDRQRRAIDIAVHYLLHSKI